MVTASNGLFSEAIFLSVGMYDCVLIFLGLTSILKKILILLTIEQSLHPGLKQFLILLIPFLMLSEGFLCLWYFYIVFLVSALR